MKIARYKGACVDCIHCDPNNLLCHPQSKDCLEEYQLEETDLYTEEWCDYFRRRGVKSDAQNM